MVGMTKELWEKIPPEERKRRTHNARTAQAVKTIAENWPELTEAQQQRLRALLRPVPEDGDVPGTAA
jgi:hypothetical protein